MTRRAAIVLLAAAACDTGAFEDRRFEAPSQSSSAPDGLASGDYGTAVAAVTGDRRGVHHAALGRAPHSLTTLSYDEDGTLTHAGLAVGELEGMDAASPTVVGSPYPIRGGDGMLALGGLGDLGAILLFNARTGVLGPQLRATLDASACGGGPLDDLGHAMVFARTDLGARDEPDLVALAGGDLVVFVDVKPDFSPTCFRCALEIIGEGEVVGLALAAGDIGGAEGEEILLTVAPAAGGPAQLVAFSASLIEEHHDVGEPCFRFRGPQISNLTGAAGEEDFGARIAVGNGDGGAGLDVALAAPSTGRVYVVRRLSASGPSGLLDVLSGDGSAVAFGAALAFGDLDGNGRDELVVGDPGAPVAGQVGAGNALIFELAEEEGAELVARLHDSTPEPEQAFGRALAVSRFVAADDEVDLLVVGAAGEVFTYFRALPDAVDPRR